MTNKNAETKLPIMDLLQKRWSPRAFSDKKIENDTLVRIFEAARWSPSCANGQPWRFIVGVKDENTTYSKITNHLDEGNKIWTKFAPVLVLLIAKKTYDNGKENAWNEYDLGQAASYITFQAMSENIYAHQMAGFNQEAITKEFNIPNDYIAKTVMALGYIGEPDILNEKLKERELLKRERKNLNDLVFSENWEEKYF
ncbi:MAG: nitroreductase family protein [Candidatus Sericytochromatia bacterium]